MPYKHLLVRKSDGKIWCVDNIKDNILRNNGSYWNPKWIVNGKFIESNRGDLYFVNYDSHAAFKFNLSSDEASFEQITTGDGTVGGDYIVTDNGIIGQAGFRNVYFGWPHSGFTKISPLDLINKTNDDYPEEIPIEGLEISECSDFKWKVERGDRWWGADLSPHFNTLSYENSIYLFAWQRYELFCKDKSDNEKFYYTEDTSERENLNKIATGTKALMPSVFKVAPGNNQGEYDLTKITNLNICNDFRVLRCTSNSNYKNQLGYGSNCIDVDYIIGEFQSSREPKFITCDNNIYIILTDLNYTQWLTRLDIKENQWQMIKKLDFDIEEYNIKYLDKLWYFNKNDKANLGIYWLDINNEDSGFVKFNVTLPNFVEYKGYENGIITYSGADPANSNKVNIYIDITTGEAVNEVNTPELIFSTIIPLN